MLSPPPGGIVADWSPQPGMVTSTWALALLGFTTCTLSLRNPGLLLWSYQGMKNFVAAEVTGNASTSLKDR